MNPRTIIILSLFGIFCLIICFIIFYNKSDKKDFYKFSNRLILCSLPTVIITFVFILFMFSKRNELNGISMSDQLIESFKNSINTKYKTYIFGNSRCYRGIDPEFISNNTFNFAYDNETFFEQYFKLQYLSNNKIIPDTIILGVDYFEFSFVSDAMSNTYAQYFPKEYLSRLNGFNCDKSSTKNNTNVDDFVNANLSNIFGRSSSQYISHLYDLIVYGKYKAPFLKKNGQYIINPVPKAKEGDFVKRDTTILDIQKEYFEKIITYSNINNIIVYLVMPPTRDIERFSYNKSFIEKLDRYFISLSNKQNIYYINYYHIDLDLNLFMDDTHLTPDGAIYFSGKLYNDIKYLQNKNLKYLFVK